jgi:hypothetical protein
MKTLLDSTNGDFIPHIVFHVETDSYWTWFSFIKITSWIKWRISSTGMNTTTSFRFIRKMYKIRNDKQMLSFIKENIDKVYDKYIILHTKEILKMKV